MDLHKKDHLLKFGITILNLTKGEKISFFHHALIFWSELVVSKLFPWRASLLNFLRLWGPRFNLCCYKVPVGNVGARVMLPEKEMFSKKKAIAFLNIKPIDQFELIQVAQSEKHYTVQ